MTKKILSIVLAVMMMISACTFIVAAEEEENAVWIEQDATGKGTEDDPMGNIADAVAKLGGKDGTVYVYGEFNFTGFKAEWEGTVTFTGVSADSKLTVNKSGAAHFNGDTIIKDIHVEVGEFAHLNTNGVNFVYDPGKDLVLGKNAMIHLGTSGAGAYETSYAEYNSGTTSHVYAAGGYSNSFANGIEGDATFVQNGGSIGTFYISADSYMATHTGISIGGNMNVILNGGTIKTFGFKSEAVAADILGALNIVLNNGMTLPSGYKLPQTVAGGTYIIHSGVGGKVMPTSEIGVFEIKADKGKVAEIDGEQVFDGKVTLSEGETRINWIAGEQPEEKTEIKLVIGKAEIVTNGEAKALDVPAQIIDSRTMVPLRAIFEALGASVEWDDATKTVTSKKDDTTVMLTIGTPVIFVNGTPKALDVAAQIVDSRTMVPARAVAEAYGCEVAWDDATKTVTITK